MLKKLGRKTKITAIITIPIVLFIGNEKFKYDFYWETFKNNP